MLQELLELIILAVDIDTVKSFALLNQYFLKFINNPKWWEQKFINHDLLYTNVCTAMVCHNASHQHHPASNKNHYTIQNWIDYYKNIVIAKTKAINTLLVYNIELSLDTKTIIQINFEKKPLMYDWIEKEICNSMIKYNVTKLIKTSIIIRHTGYTIKCVCHPRGIKLSSTGPVSDYFKIFFLTCYYNDSNATITNKNNESFINNKTWQIADYLGHIIK